MKSLILKHAMSKDRSNTLHREWTEKSVSNGSLKEVWNGHES